MTLPARSIGDLQVSAAGLGCMPMSFPGMVDQRDRAIATIHRALDLGITMLDTADVYCPTWDSMGHNEALIAEALRNYSGTANVAEVLVTTKGGITLHPNDEGGRDSSTAGLRAACEASLRQLGLSVIELYQHHRHDPSQTYAAQMGALLALRDAGLIRRIGLSNVNASELSVALEILGGPDDGGLMSVQNEYSPRFRGDADVLARCTELGIAFLPWSPLGGSEQAHEVGSHYTAFAEVGAEIGASAQETIIAWLLALSPVIIPIPGATRAATVDSIVRALTLELSSEQFERLQATVPANESVFPDPLPRSPLR